MSEENIVRIATRRSPLAMWQAEYVRDRLLEHHPGLEVEFVKMVTQGDKILDTPLAKVGGKGLFVKELEVGMLEGQADLAVVCPREDPRDAFVSNTYKRFEDLPQGARVGTSSMRRQCQLREQRPDLEILDLRGNVNTRLKKLDDGEYDAIILAAAGLIRLEFQDRITEYLAPEVSLPAIGQGAVGIECRIDDERIHHLLDVLNDEETAIRIRAERAFNHRLEGGCQVPIAGYSIIEGEEIWMRGLVGRPDGTEIVRGEVRGPITEAHNLGIRLADDLLGRGAEAILKDVYAQA